MTQDVSTTGPPTSLLVVIPALDEAATVADVIRRVPRPFPGIGAIEVLVVDDGSRDQTFRIAVDAGATVIRHPRTLGVGAAFQTALSYGVDHGVDMIATIDSDGQFDPADIPKLTAPIISGDADFTTASRFKDPRLTPKMPWLKLWGNRMMSRLISYFVRGRFHDVSCGMRCYSRRAALHLCLIGEFTYTQEVFLNLAHKRMRIVEVPIAVRGVREHGESRVAGNLWRYGARTMKIIIRWYRDYHPMRFFFGVAMAFMLAGIGFASFLLAHYLRTGGFSPHKWAGFCAGAAVGLAILMLHTGIIGDMLVRHRIYLEEILLRQRDARRIREDRGEGAGS